ncbi:hypothetical protein HanRHA438_Chr11g0498131 [Helianthus annuus]|nr:hypothetical protein HanRHA438_Chr11g0498131 [Helianthus annuus]
MMIRFIYLLSDNFIHMVPLSTPLAILQQRHVPAQTYQVGSTKQFFQRQNLRQEALEATHELENGFLRSQFLHESKRKFAI